MHMILHIYIHTCMNMYRKMDDQILLLFNQTVMGEQIFSQEQYLWNQYTFIYFFQFPTRIFTLLLCPFIVHNKGNKFFLYILFILICNTIFIIMFYRREFKIEYTEHIITLFQQWDFDMKNVEDLEDNLTVGITIGVILNLL